MSEVLIQESTLSAIGDAIRSKTGSTNLMSPAEMVTAIDGITVGGNDILNLNNLNLSFETKSVYSTSQCLNANNLFSFTLPANFVFGVIYFQIAIREGTATTALNSYIGYRSAYLIWPKEVENITSADNAFNWYRLTGAGGYYYDDPTIKRISLSTNDLELLQNGNTNVTLYFSLGRRGTDESSTTVLYTEKVGSAQNNNIRLYSACSK